MTQDTAQGPSAPEPLVSLGPECCIDPGATIGCVPGRSIPELRGSIGGHAVVRSGTVIYAGTEIGDGLETGHHAVIREQCRIGHNFRIWNHSTVDYGCVIGNGVRIHCSVYVAQFTEIEDDVFIAPGVMIGNDPHPVCTRCMKGPTIKRGARIGINATLLPQVTIGEEALVGAGAVVTHDVPPRAVVVGNPARVVSSIDQLVCKSGLCERPYGGSAPPPPPAAAAAAAVPPTPPTPATALRERVVLVLPALNEEGKIGKVVGNAMALPPGIVDEVLVVDDGSTDQTASEAARYGAKVIRHGCNRGVGAAIRTGIDYARANAFDIVVVMGSDDQDKPSEIPRVLAPILSDRFVFVQGSRYAAGGARVNIPLFRWVTTALYSLIFRVIMRFPVSDGTNGFRAFRTRIFEDSAINLWQPWLDRYELEPYLYYKVIERGLAVTDAPVTKSYPTGKVGYTKMVPLRDWWSIFRPLVYLRLGLRH